MFKLKFFPVLRTETIDDKSLKECDTLKEAYKLLKSLDPKVNMKNRYYSEEGVPCCIDFSTSDSFIRVETFGEAKHILDELCNTIKE